MKISDVMHEPLFLTAPDTPLSEIRRLIFSLGLSSIYIAEDKKLVGVITENDILKYISPDIEKVLENIESDQAGSTEKAEGMIESMVAVPASSVMTPVKAFVAPEDSLIKAQKLMGDLGLKRLPVLDTAGILVGIVSYGDILRSLMKSQISKHHAGRYARFIAEYHDTMVDWKARYELEFSTLFKVFEREKTESVLDLVTWTGEYSIELAKQGIKKLVGLDDQQLLVNIAQEKLKDLPKDIQGKITFQYSDFSNIPGQLSDKFDAVLLMGNALPYLHVDLKKLFQDLSKVLNPEKGIIMMQVINFKKLLGTKNGLLSFRVQPGSKNKNLYIEFVDQEKGSNLTHNIVSFEHDKNRWIYQGTNTIPIHQVMLEDIQSALTSAGFTKITVGGNLGDYQGDHGKLSFTKPFDEQESDWLNVLAKK